jgi:hypothetical protein
MIDPHPSDQAAAVSKAPLSRSEANRYASPDGAWRAILVLLLSFGVPTYLFATTDDVGRSSAWTLAIPVILWSGWRLAELISSGSENYAALMFWVFNYIFFGLAVLVQVRTGLLPTTTPRVLPTLDEQSMVAVIVSLLAFELGSAWGTRRTGFAPLHVREGVRVKSRSVVVVAWFGLLFSWAYLAKVGVSNVTASRIVHHDTRYLVWPDPAVAEMAYAASFVPLLVAAHLLLLARSRPDLVSAPRTKRALLPLVLVSLLLIVNPFGTPRYIFGAVWLSIVIQLKIARSIRQLRLLNLGIVVAFLFVFPIADKYSRPGSSKKTVRAFEVFQGNGDYDAFAQTNNGVNLVKHLGYSWGRQLLGVVFFWVPRSIWTGKPTDTGVVIAQFMGYNYTNLSSPLVAEFYINGGIVLVSFGFIAIGYGVSLARQRVRALDSAAICVVACVVPFYSPILLRGSLLQATGFAALFAVVILLVRMVSVGPAEGIPTGEGRAGR